jgi:adenosylhomocysteinase
MFPDGPNMILDDGGDATLYVLLGARAEAGEDIIPFLNQRKKRLSRCRLRSVWSNHLVGLQNT